MRRCRACGSRLDEKDGSCPSCGASADDSTASFAPVSEATEQAEALIGIEGPALVVRKGPESGEKFYLDGDRFTIGRDPGSDIFLNDVTVSRKHAEITLNTGEALVRDVGSLNGTYVNDVRVDAAPLTSGDVVRIGRFQMVFVGSER